MLSRDLLIALHASRHVIVFSLVKFCTFVYKVVKKLSMHVPYTIFF